MHVMRRRLGFLLVSSAVALVCFAHHGADLGGRSVEAAPAALPAVPQKPVPNPQASAIILAALTRYADGATKDLTGIDRSLAARLARIPNARAIAKRLTSRVAGLSASERSVELPGVLPTALSAKFVASDYQKSLGPIAVAAPEKVDKLPSQKTDTNTPSSYGIDYAGLTATRPLTPTGDKLAVYTTTTDYYGGTNNPGYVTSSKLLPASGSFAGPAAGATSAAGAGVVGNMSLYGTTEVLTALLIDDGTLDAQKQDIDVLQAAAETLAAALDTDDRIAALDQALKQTLSTLYLSNPARWTLDAVTTRIITMSDFDAMYASNAHTTNGVGWKFSGALEPRPNTSYTLFFTTAGGHPPLVPVTVSIDHLTALGTTKDDENGLADFHAEVTLSGPKENGGATARATFTKDTNDVRPNWAAERKMFAGEKVHISIGIFDRDKPPKSNVWTGGWGIGCSVCGDISISDCGYVGPCPPIYNPVDVNPKAGSSRQTIELVYDLTTGAITGDLTGKKGDMLSATGNSARTKTKIDFKIE